MTNSKWKTKMEFCQIFHDWLERRPRHGVVLLQNEKGARAIIFYSNPGIVFQLEDNELSPLLFPEKADYEFVDSYENTSDLVLESGWGKNYD
jgi:hypothetical protein